MENRNGDLVSAQISVAGNVDFSGGNFRMDTPFLIKNRHKAQRKAKFYINKCRSASCMQGGLKQASA